MAETSIEEVIKELGLPEEAKFAGYAIHLKEEDEFMHSYQSNKLIEQIAWTGTPNSAHLFDDFNKALEVKNEMKPEAKVVHIWDVGNQYAVTLAHD